MSDYLSPDEGGPFTLDDVEEAIGCLGMGEVKEEPLLRSCLDSREVRTTHCPASGPS